VEINLGILLHRLKSEAQFGCVWKYTVLSQYTSNYLPGNKSKYVVVIHRNIYVDTFAVDVRYVLAYDYQSLFLHGPTPTLAHVLRQ